MPWLRVGDTVAWYPPVVALAELPDADGRSLNEVFGFLVRAASLSAAHLTDGMMSRTILESLSPPRWKKLTAQAVAVGLLRPVKRNNREFWQLIDDPDFLHIRLRDEVEFERQRKRDQSTPALTVPVRERDGDLCRYCSVIVNWGARTGGRAGTYDHTSPGQPATIDTYVVACRKCNSSRGDDPDANSRIPLLPVPVAPYMSDSTKRWLAKYPEFLTGSCQEPDRSRSGSPDHSLSDEGPARVRGGNGAGPGRDGSRDGAGPDLPVATS